MSPGALGVQASRRAACSLALLVIALLALASPAHASFPGQNGKIAFYDNDGSHAGVFVMNSDGSGATPVADGFVGPRWSPDGTRFAAPSTQGGNTDIWTVNADGTGAIRLTTDPAVDTQPSWSPDGSHIAFATNRNGNFEIYYSPNRIAALAEALHDRPPDLFVRVYEAAPGSERGCSDRVLSRLRSERHRRRLISRQALTPSRRLGLARGCRLPDREEAATRRQCVGKTRPREKGFGPPPSARSHWRGVREAAVPSPNWELPTSARWCRKLQPDLGPRRAAAVGQLFEHLRTRSRPV